MVSRHGQAVVGVRNVTGRVRSGETIIIDGAVGAIIVNPLPETLRFYVELRERQQEQQLHYIEERDLPAVTRDGLEVRLRANIELIEEIETLQRFNAYGVGLYRSEFLYSQAASGLPSEDAQYEAGLRPRSLDEYIGQDRVRDNLHVSIAAARGRKEALDHVLLYGPPGLGKTTLAYVIGNELGVPVRATEGPVIEKPGDLAAILTNLQQHEVLFIDEIHRLAPAIEEILYPAMEDY